MTEGYVFGQAGMGGGSGWARGGKSCGRSGHPGRWIWNGVSTTTPSAKPSPPCTSPPSNSKARAAWPQAAPRPCRPASSWCPRPTPLPFSRAGARRRPASGASASVVARQERRGCAGQQDRRPSGRAGFVSRGQAGADTPAGEHARPRRWCNEQHGPLPAGRWRCKSDHAAPHVPAVPRHRPNPPHGGSPDRRREALPALAAERGMLGLGRVCRRGVARCGIKPAPQGGPSLFREATSPDVLSLCRLWLDDRLSRKRRGCGPCPAGPSRDAPRAVLP